jgi:hypothetical protein
MERFGQFKGLAETAMNAAGVDPNDSECNCVQHAHGSAWVANNA